MISMRLARIGFILPPVVVLAALGVAVWKEDVHLPGSASEFVVALGYLLLGVVMFLPMSVIGLVIGGLVGSFIETALRLVRRRPGESFMLTLAGDEVDPEEAVRDGRGEFDCLACGQAIPPKADACPRCGWSYGPPS